MLGRDGGMWCHRQAMKRRCSSPRYFPRKVHISEEKVAEELGNLSIGMTCSRAGQSQAFAESRPNFFVGEKRPKTFQEIEDSLDLDDDVPEVNQSCIELAPELVREIKNLKRKILVPGTYRPLKKIPESCTELVLWQPPSGTVQQIMDLVSNFKSEAEGQQEDMRHHTDYCTDMSMPLEEGACSSKDSNTVQTIPDSISLKRQLAQLAPHTQNTAQAFGNPSSGTSIRCLPEPLQLSPYFKPIRDSDFSSFCQRDIDECEMEL